MRLLSNPVAFLSTDNAEATTTFYRDTLGLTLVADEPFALVFDLGTIRLRIQKVEQVAPSSGTMLGWEVEEIETLVAELVGRGVNFERYPHIEQDALGIWISPSTARVAWFRDPCGQLLSITQQ